MATIAAVVICAPGATAFADQDPDPVSADATLTSVPLSDPTSLASAEAIASNLDADVVGYRFDNAYVVGEFFPADQSAQTFVADFAAKWGTDPSVTAVIELDNDGSATSANSPINTSAHKFKARKISAATLRKNFPNARGISSRATAAEPAVSSSDWRAEAIAANVYRSGTHQYLNTEVLWSSTSPTHIPSGYGLEDQIDLYNTASSTKVRGKDDCGSNYKDHFIAKNYSYYSWYASSPSSSLSSAQPYADYNDLLDPCNDNSMSIGVRYPRKISGSELDTSINAHTGTETSNTVNGELQLVHDDCGANTPTSALTDCMGLDESKPSGIANYELFLNKSRGWKASPNLCWDTNDYGNGTPEKQSC